MSITEAGLKHFVARGQAAQAAADALIKPPRKIGKFIVRRNGPGRMIQYLTRKNAWSVHPTKAKRFASAPAAMRFLRAFGWDRDGVFVEWREGEQ